VEALLAKLSEHFAGVAIESSQALTEITLTVEARDLVTVATRLKDNSAFQFNQLIDVCGIDYLHYGVSEWQTESTTTTGFERGRDVSLVMHLKLNMKKLNHRLR
jgi:NADH-quinone oxidoreductase subunit C